MPIKKVALKNFAIFTGKHSSTKCFPVNIAKLLRTFILKNIFQRLCGSKNQHKIGLKNWWIGQVFLTEFFVVITHVSLIREATVFIFRETGGWLPPKWTWIINKSISMNQSQKFCSIKNFAMELILAVCKIWDVTISVFRQCNWPQREDLGKPW